MPRPPEVWKEQVHGLDRLDLAGGLGGPGDGPSGGPGDGPVEYEGHQRRLVDHYVVVQLWSDDPVREHLDRGVSGAG